MASIQDAEDELFPSPLSNRPAKAQKSIPGEFGSHLDRARSSRLCLYFFNLLMILMIHCLRFIKQRGKKKHTFAEKGRFPDEGCCRSIAFWRSGHRKPVLAL
jgi:hypothetical protein